MLPNVPTYVGANPDDLEVILERIDELVVKAVDQSGGYGMLIGPAATPAEREEFRRRVAAEPRELHRAADDRALPPPDVRPRRAPRLPRRPAPVRPVRRRRRADRPRRPDPHRAPRGLARRQLVPGRRQQGHLGAGDRLMLSRVAESPVLDGALRRARGGRDAAPRRRLPRAPRRPRRGPRRGVAAARRAARRRKTPTASTSTSFTAQTSPTGSSGTTATRTRSSSCITARAGERALGARADLRRDVGGDQLASSSSSGGRTAAPSRAGRTRSSSSSATGRTASRAAPTRR